MSFLVALWAVALMACVALGLFYLLRPLPMQPVDNWRAAGWFAGAILLGVGMWWAGP